jgi:hypothetical protein
MPSQIQTQTSANTNSPFPYTTQSSTGTDSPSASQQSTESPHESTPKPPLGFLGTDFPMEYGYAIITAVVIILVAGVSLVYFKKLRKQKANG